MPRRPDTDPVLRRVHEGEEPLHRASGFAVRLTAWPGYAGLGLPGFSLEFQEVWKAWNISGGPSVTKGLWRLRPTSPAHRQKARHGHKGNGPPSCEDRFSMEQKRN